MFYPQTASQSAPILELICTQMEEHDGMQNNMVVCTH